MDMTMEEKNRMISQQDARVLAVQSEFNVSYDIAELLVKDMDYNTLVCCGMNPEIIEQQVSEEERSRAHR